MPADKNWLPGDDWVLEATERVGISETSAACFLGEVRETQME
jgi:hypothetical protein